MKKAIKLLETKIWLCNFELGEGVTKEREEELVQDILRLSKLLIKLRKRK